MRWVPRRVRLDALMLLVVIVALIVALGLKAREARILRVSLDHFQSRLASAQARAAWAEARAEWSDPASPGRWGLNWREQTNYPKWLDRVRAEDAATDKPGVEP